MRDRYADLTTPVRSADAGSPAYVQRQLGHAAVNRLDEESGKDTWPLFPSSTTFMRLYGVRAKEKAPRPTS